MIIVAVCATVVLVAQAAALVLVVRMLVASQESERAGLLAAQQHQRTELIQAREVSDQAQAQERRDLTTRIQQPDRIPVVPMPNFVIPEQEPDEIELVGTIAEFDGEETE